MRSEDEDNSSMNTARNLWRGLQKRSSADGREKLLKDFTETFSEEEDLNLLNEAFTNTKRKTRKVPFEIELATEYICAGRHGRPLDFAHSKFAVRIRRVYHSTGWRILIIGGCSIHTLLLLLDLNMQKEDIATISVSAFFAILYIIDAAAYLLSYRCPRRYSRRRKDNDDDDDYSVVVDSTDATWAILRLVMALAMIIDSMILLDRGESCTLKYCFLPTDSLRPLVGVFRMRHVRNIFVGAFVKAPRRLLVIGSIIAGQILWAGVFGWLLLANPDYREDDKPNTMSDTIGASIYQFLLLFMCPPELFKIEGPFMDTEKVIPATLLTVTFIVLGRLFLYRLITASAVGAFKAQLKRNVMKLLHRRKNGTVNAFQLLSRVSKRNRLLARAAFEGRRHLQLEGDDEEDEQKKEKEEDVEEEGVSASTWRALYVYFKDGNGFFGTKRLCRNANQKGYITRSKLKACADAFFAVVFRKKIRKLAPHTAPQPPLHNSNNTFSSKTSDNVTALKDETKFAQDSVQWKKELNKHVAKFAPFCELCYFLDVHVHRISRKNKKSCFFKIKSRCARPRMFVRRFLESVVFRGMIDVLVLVSVIQICAASNLGRVGSLVDNDDWLWVLGFTLMWFFVLEITLKVFAYGPKKMFLNNQYEDSQLKYKDKNVSATGTLLNWLDLVTVLSSFMSYYIPNFSTFTLVPHPTKKHNQVFRALYALRIFRLARLIKRVATSDMQKHLAVTGEILPAAARALAVYATIIFFFANIGHGMFRSALTDHAHELCNGTLTSSSTPPRGYDTKDVTSWCGLRKELHFGNFASSLLTMFTVASFGNWKIVMEAAAAAKGSAQSRIFFFTFHFCTVTLALPVLIGYLIQIYIAAYARHWTNNDDNLKNNNNRWSCCFKQENGDDEETQQQQQQESPSVWQREMRAVTQAMNHRRRLRRRRRQEGPDVRRDLNSSSSESSSSSSSSDDENVDGVEYINGRRKRPPRMSWKPGYGEFQIALFDDIIMDKSNVTKNNHDDNGIEYYRSALERTALELAAAQQELAELRQCSGYVENDENDASSGVVDIQVQDDTDDDDVSLRMRRGRGYSKRVYSKDRLFL